MAEAMQAQAANDHRPGAKKRWRLEGARWKRMAEEEAEREEREEREAGFD